ncbi:MAG: WD40 repeat domain-containing protein [Terriglobales bacterium]
MKAKLIGSLVLGIFFLAGVASSSSAGGLSTLPAPQEESAQLHYLNLFSIYGATLKLDGEKLSSFWKSVNQIKPISTGPHVVTAVMETYSETGAYSIFTRSAEAHVAFEAKRGEQYMIVNREGRTEAREVGPNQREWEPQVRYWLEQKGGRFGSFSSKGMDLVSKPLVQRRDSPASAADLQRAMPAQLKTADQVLRDHAYAVYSVAITSDGKILASGSGDGTVKLWSLPDGKLLATPLKNLGEVTALAVTPDDKILAVGNFAGGSYEVRLLSLPEGRLLQSLKGFHSGVTSVALSPDGKNLAAGSLDGTILLFSLPEGKLLATMKQKKTGGVRAVVVTSDGKTVISGFTDGAIRLWSMSDARLLATLREHQAAVRALVITPDGKSFASGSRDQTIKVWSLPDGHLLSTLDGNLLGVNALAIIRDGRALVSGSSDYAVRIWSLADGHLLTTWMTSGRPDALAVTPDGKKIAGALWDDTVRLWSLPE